MSPHVILQSVQEEHLSLIDWIQTHLFSGFTVFVGSQIDMMGMEDLFADLYSQNLFDVFNSELLHSLPDLVIEFW